MALRARGLALHELGDTAAAHHSLARAAEVAQRAHLPHLAAQARASRLGLLARRGAGAAALLEHAVRREPATRALALLNRGVAASQQGRFDAALSDFDAAEQRLRGGGDDRLLLPGLLSNRGLALLYTGNPHESTAVLERAAELAQRHHLHHLRGLALQNLGCAAAGQGDIARAMLLFATAAGFLPPGPRETLLMDRAGALLAAGQFRDAETLLRSVAPAMATDAGAGYATHLLLRAKLLLGIGDRDGAATLARRVNTAFGPASVWSRLARQIEWAARHVPPAPTTKLGQAQPRRTCAPLARAPREAASRHAGVSATAAAATLASSVATAPLGAPALAAPPPSRLRALRALAQGDHTAARAHLERPDDTARPGRLTVAGHLEPLAHVPTAATTIARAGAHLALEAGQAWPALEWIERVPTAPRPKRRCRDTSWRRLLDRYRAACARAWTHGDQDEPWAHGHTPLDEVERIETELGLAQWHAGCVRRCAPEVPATGAAGPTLASALGRRVFLRYVELAGQVNAVVMVDGEVTLRPLGEAGAIADAAAKLLHAARLNAVAPEVGQDAVTADRASHLADLLVAPVADLLAERPVVLAPEPGLPGLPWGLLPGLTGRPLVVASSARAWLCRRRRVRHQLAAERTVLVAGPDLPGAGGETRRLRRIYPGATLLAGEGAARPTTARVLAELGRADLAHLSAHGVFPPRSPMLSGLLLADGPLLAYDLERAHRVPRVTVLSSCAVGRSVASPTGVPLGLAATLLAMGATTVVAGILPVRDDAITDAMTRAHTDLSRGVSPAKVVARHLAHAGFVCLGAG
ncbi:CHAT domain-containing protein [Salinactinospora qingdaonensis]|uniref:CHAT domain-containing protein n=1 Tax=Salinactinospora qingdaonensis TaxID=702744 RepID=A0ABP7ESR8_9ACTN